MESEIGDAAGVIWRYLDKHGVTTLSRLRQQVKLSELIILMGIGWLAREGQAEPHQKGQDCEAQSDGAAGSVKAALLVLTLPTN